MKVVFIHLCLISVTLSAENVDISNITEKIDKISTLIKKTKKLDYNVYDPFAMAKPILKKEKTTEEPTKASRPITIEVILNDRAFIERRWCSIGDEIRGFKIKSVENNFIKVIKDGRLSVIKLKSIKNIVQTREFTR